MSEIKFPCLFESVYNKQIVKFYSEHEGEVIIRGWAPCSWDVGTRCSDLYSCYDTSHWKPHKQPENKPMNISTKEQALARLEAIEAEQKELRKLLEAPEKEEVVGSLLTSGVNSALAMTKFTSYLNCQFGTEEYAQAYSSAFETFIKLRQQPGSVGIKDSIHQYTIEVDNKFVNLFTNDYCSIMNKGSSLSPCFSTQEYAEAAIKSVGEEAILQMMKTFSHYEGE